MAPKTNKVASVNLTGFTSSELTALSRRCLAERKVLNAKARDARKGQDMKKKADRIAYLQAELAKLAK